MSSPDAPGAAPNASGDDDESVYASLRAGAGGFLVKDMALDDLLAAIRVVTARDALIAPGVTRRLIADFAGCAPQTPPSVHQAPAGRLDLLTSVVPATSLR